MLAGVAGAFLSMLPTPLRTLYRSRWRFFFQNKRRSPLFLLAKKGKLASPAYLHAPQDGLDLLRQRVLPGNLSCPTDVMSKRAAYCSQRFFGPMAFSSGCRCTSSKALPRCIHMGTRPRNEQSIGAQHDLFCIF